MRFDPFVIGWTDLRGKRRSPHRRAQQDLADLPCGRWIEFAKKVTAPTPRA
jgi:hypothetical protein